MGIISPKLRASARGQPCTLQIAGTCNHDPETTILAHLPSEVAGRSTKSDDFNACFSCSACHEMLDMHLLPKQSELYYCLRALQRTQKIWRDMGLLVIAGDNEKPRTPSNKVIARSSLYRQMGD
jgi:hypothetical protein